MVASSMPQTSTGRPASGCSSAVDSAISTSGSEEDLIIDIAPQGDIVLIIEHEFATSSKHTATFRVSSSIRENSKYFDRLLQPGRFGEGEGISAQHARLREQYKSMADVPAEELPIVRVQDVGRISTIKSLSSLCTDFLDILHGRELQQPPPPVANLANLAIVADRFDALDAVRSYVRRKKIMRAIDGKTTAKADNALSEERARQRLLVAAMLDDERWMEKYSARLIMKGWVGREVEVTEPLWWDLPSRLEEELAHRRDCILETVQSLQTFFLAQYTSRERQCKLGYDSSPQCDSFQLGEMVRFFSKVGMLRLQGGIFASCELPEPFTGDIAILLDKLRQAPEYQIDRFHNHCGIRTKILPLLDLLSEAILHVGTCAECWANDRENYAWMDAKRPILWRRGAFNLRTQDHRKRHACIKDMCTATERDWS
ncbi:hypothetical protein LTR62_005785 [Meristemomyces frigidus]|uniref:BTB domain-containing protein n=1 Tax=Meristemomyces frigidus TaxID=1508187 RepID=A0AAN7TE24_9PEZI|nr:hypothetical protein LTR62_005785 [Meristemomyces frigidus]